SPGKTDREEGRHEAGSALSRDCPAPVEPHGGADAPPEPLGGTQVGGRSWRTVSRGREPPQPRDTPGSRRTRTPRKCSFKGTGGEDPQEASTQPQSSPREKKYKCEDCGKVFASSSNRTRHRWNHMAEKPFKCQDCGKGFTLSTYLLNHQRAHTKEKPFVCTTCGKCFSWPSNLHVHQRVHTEERPYSCSCCGKTFRQKNLLRHQRMHTKEQPYLCTTCGKRFTWQSNLITHRRIHTEEKLHACSQCGMMFQKSCQLESHQKSVHNVQNGESSQGHRKDEIFREPQKHSFKGTSAEHLQESTTQPRRRCRQKKCKCEECGKVFMSVSSLSRHRKIHMGEKPFKCQDCGKSFTESGNFGQELSGHPFSSGERFDGLFRPPPIKLLLHPPTDFLAFPLLSLILGSPPAGGSSQDPNPAPS
uniref:C2H2-type domain-containing protein n=1 Tax=Athene cunicularia TaxID=194338 RepID=A0A663N118_ATHCN